MVNRQSILKGFVGLLCTLFATIALAVTPLGSWTQVQQSTDPFSQAGVAQVADAEAMVVAVCLYDTGAPAFTSITFGGNAFTLSNRTTVDTGEQTGLYYLTNLPGGTQTLAIDHAGPIDEGMHVFYRFYDDVDVAGTPTASLGSASSGANDATVNTPTAGTVNTDDLAIGVGCVFGTDGVTLNSEVLDGAVFNSNDGAVAEITATGAVTFTVTTGDFPSVSGMILRDGSGGGGGTGIILKRRMH